VRFQFCKLQASQYSIRCANDRHCSLTAVALRIQVIHTEVYRFLYGSDSSAVLLLLRVLSTTAFGGATDFAAAAL
jgi:hypothetical protein